MSALISYPATFALHLVAIIAFVSGLFLTALSLPGLARRPNAAEIARLRRWNAIVTSPALLLVWAAGLTLADEGGWFASGWLHAKIAIVLGLSALHGIQSARLRRLARGETLRRAPTMRPLLLVVIGVAAIVILVTAKPW